MKLQIDTSCTIPNLAPFVVRETKSVANTLKKTKALVIGIAHVNEEDVHGKPDSDNQWETLDGPHVDVEKMEEFLTSLKYEEVRVLADQIPRVIPDKETIIRHLEWLVEDAQPGQELFLHYSGHGGQRPTTSPEEPDGFDEAIVPYGCPPIYKSGRYCSTFPCKCASSEELKFCTRLGYEGLITDDELKGILVDKVPVGCHLMALFDCCNSGTILDLAIQYKGAEQILCRTPGVPVYVHCNRSEEEAYVVCDSPISSPFGDSTRSTVTVRKDTRRQTFRKATLSQISYPDDYLPRVTVISACRDDKTVFEVQNEKRWAGLLTTAFLRFMSRAKYRSMTWKDLISKMRFFYDECNESRRSDRFSPEQTPYPVVSLSAPMNMDNRVIA